MDIVQVLLLAATWSLWRDLSDHDLPQVNGDLIFIAFTLLLQWVICYAEELARLRAKPRESLPITEEEEEADLEDLFGSQREFQVSCDGPFNEEGEPTGECNAVSPACDSGPESHERARDLGWLVSEDGHGWDLCPVHRGYDDESVPS